MKMKSEKMRNLAVTWHCILKNKFSVFNLDWNTVGTGYL